MKTFLSFDCASKTLACARLTVNTQYKKDVVECLTAWCDGARTFAETAVRMIEIASTVIVIHSLSVVDLIPGVKVRECSELVRTRALKAYLRTVDDARLREPATTNVIIEHQPPRVGRAANTNSTQIAHQLAFHYSDMDVCMIDPKCKNMLTIAKVGSYADFRGKCKDNYSARKTHSRQTFEELAAVFGFQAKLVGIKKTTYDDIADATLQALYVAFQTP